MSSDSSFSVINKPSNFTNHLFDRLDFLGDDWVVGLSQIRFTNSVFVPDRFTALSINTIGMMDNDFVAHSYDSSIEEKDDNKVTSVLISERKISNLFVHSDIIRPYVVGDKMLPILQTLPSPWDHPFMAPVYHEFDEDIAYHHVLPSYIENINISIRDDHQNEIPFLAGNAVVKLHFKRCNIIKD